MFYELFEKLSDFSRKSLTKIGFDDDIAMFMYQLISIQINQNQFNNIITLNDNNDNNKILKKIKFNSISSLNTVLQQLNSKKQSKRKKNQEEFK